MALHPDLGTNNPIVYLIKLISKRMQKEVNEETAIVWRQRLEVREKNLDAIFQSAYNREMIKLAKEAFVKLTEKKEKYDKANDGVSVYDKMIKFLGSINISLKMADTAQLANVALAPGIIAGKVSAFIEEQKKEIKYITRVAKTQKKIIKEDLKFYGAGLDALIEEINRGDDDYRQEILLRLDPWAQQDPYIANAPYNLIIPRYRARTAAHELSAIKDQQASGKKIAAGWGLEEGIKVAVLGAAASSLYSSAMASKNSVEAASKNIGTDTGTDASEEANKVAMENEYLNEVARGMLSATELNDLESAAAGNIPGPVHNAFQNIS